MYFYNYYNIDGCKVSNSIFTTGATTQFNLTNTYQVHYEVRSSFYLLLF